MFQDVTIEMICPFCEKHHSVTVNFDDYCEVMEGAPIQEVLYYKTPTVREQLISNICPDCQKSIFGRR